MADWFYGKDNTQHGPVSDLEVRNLISTGLITQDTIIWREGMTDWLPMKSVPDFQPAQGAQEGGAGQTASAQNAPYATPQTYAGQPPYAGAAPTDGLSIASLVCGILATMSCVYGGLLGVPAIICGHISMKKINTSPVPVQGKGMAIAGLITGYLGILMSIGMLVFVVIAVANSANYSP